MKKAFSFLLSLVLIAGVFMTFPLTSSATGDSQTGFDPDEAKVYFIRNKHSGKYLDVESQSTYDGASLIQCVYTEGKNQQWGVKKVADGSYQLYPIHALTDISPIQKAMSVPNNSTANDTEIKMYTENTFNSKWNIIKNSYGDKTYRIIDKNSGKALAVKSASYSDNARIILYDYSVPSTQDPCQNDDWIFEPVMNVEIYYDSDYLTKVNATDAVIQSTIKGYFQTVANAFYQTYGLRYLTPKFIKNTTSSTDSYVLRDNLKINLPPCTLRIQYTGKNVSPGGLADANSPVVATGYSFGINNNILLGHEITHTFNLHHHDGNGNLQYCMMGMHGLSDETGISLAPNWWCDDCKAVIQRDMARYSLFINPYIVDYTTFSFYTERYIKLSGSKISAERLSYNLTQNGYTFYNLKSSSGVVLPNSSLIGTGMLVYFSKSSSPAAFMAIVPGDVDGDGMVSVSDIAVLNKHIMGTSTLTGAYFRAGDLDGDESITVTDLNMLTQMVMS